AAPAQADAVAMLQRPLGDLFVVNEGAVARAAILQHVLAVVAQRNLGVLAGDIHAVRAQIALALPPDAENRLVDDDHTAAAGVVDLETRRVVLGGGGFGHSG